MQSGPGELRPHEQRHQPADHEEGERGHQVHQADCLVVGRIQQLGEDVALARLPGRVRRRLDRRRSQRGHVGSSWATASDIAFRVATCCI